MERIAQLVQLSTSAERLVRKSFGVRERTQQRHLLSTPTIKYEGLFMLISVTSLLIFEALAYRFITFWSKTILM